MPLKKHSVEQIIAKLREIEKLTGQGKSRQGLEEFHRFPRAERSSYAGDAFREPQKSAARVGQPGARFSSFRWRS